VGCDDTPRTQKVNENTYYKLPKDLEEAGCKIYKSEVSNDSYSEYYT